MRETPFTSLCLSFLPGKPVGMAMRWQGSDIWLPGRCPRCGPADTACSHPSHAGRWLWADRPSLEGFPLQPGTGHLVPRVAAPGLLGAGEHASSQTPATTGLAPGPEMLHLTGSLGEGPTAALHGGWGLGPQLTEVERGWWATLKAPCSLATPRPIDALKGPWCDSKWPLRSSRGALGFASERGGLQVGLVTLREEAPQVTGREGKGKLSSHTLSSSFTSRKKSQNTPC